MERKTLFFPLLFNILEHLIFGYLIFYHHPLAFTFTFTFTYNINYLFNLLTFKHSNILNNQLLLFMIITIQRLFLFFVLFFFNTFT